MTPRSRGRGRLVIAALFTLAGLALLIGLGVWQLERKVWKEALIARLEQRLSAEPAALPPPSTWPRLSAQESEFRRVLFSAEFRHGKEALIYSAGSGLRTDVSGPGYWVMTPAQLPGGSIVMVNRGFVPEARRDPASRKEGQVQGLVDITGVMRWPQARGYFTPADDPRHNLWFIRDHLAIAAAKDVGKVAPFYIEMEAPPLPGGLPRVGKLTVNLRNAHLQYALTWFALALALLTVFLIWAVRRPR